MNWFEIDANWFEIDTNWFEYVNQFEDANWFEIDVNWFEINANWFEIDANWFGIDANWFEIDANLFEIEYAMITQWLRNYFFKKVWNLGNEVITMTTSYSLSWSKNGNGFIQLAKWGPFKIKIGFKRVLFSVTNNCK